MDVITSFAAAVEGTAFVKALKFSQTGYAIANTFHVFGFVLLAGSIIPLDLRLLGLWRGIDQSALARMLTPLAALGLVIAVSAGCVLFSVRAGHYVNVSLFWWKLGLIAAGASLAILFHIRAGIWIERATRRQSVLHGAASLICWAGALAAGRLIAYFPNGF